jgi:hypothetical protein
MLSISAGSRVHHNAAYAIPYGQSSRNRTNYIISLIAPLKAHSYYIQVFERFVLQRRMMPIHVPATSMMADLMA